MIDLSFLFRSGSSRLTWTSFEDKWTPGGSSVHWTIRTFKETHVWRTSGAQLRVPVTCNVTFAPLTLAWSVSCCGAFVLGRSAHAGEASCPKSCVVFRRFHSRQRWQVPRAATFYRRYMALKSRASLNKRIWQLPPCLPRQLPVVVRRLCHLCHWHMLKMCAGSMKN